MLVLTSVKNVAANNSATVDVTAQSGKAFIGKVTVTNETADEKVKLSATGAITPGAITVTAIVSGDAAHSKITFSNAAAKADVAQVKTAIAAAVVSLSFTATTVPA